MRLISAHHASLQFSPLLFLGLLSLVWVALGRAYTDEELAMGKVVEGVGVRVG
jgi:hypothetical protein